MVKMGEGASSSGGEERVIQISTAVFALKWILQHWSGPSLDLVSSDCIIINLQRKIIKHFADDLRDATCVFPVCWGYFKIYPNLTLDSCLSHHQPTPASLQLLLLQSSSISVNSIIIHQIRPIHNVFPDSSLFLSPIFVHQQIQSILFQNMSPNKSFLISFTATTLLQATIISDLDDYNSLLISLSASILETSTLSYTKSQSGSLKV